MNNNKKRIFVIFIIGLFISTAPLAFFIRSANAYDLCVTWDPPLSNEDGSPIIGKVGYRVYWGESSRSYTREIDSDTNIVAIIRGLEAGHTYYLAVTAYDYRDMGSNFSDELIWPNNTNSVIDKPSNPVRFRIL